MHGHFQIDSLAKWKIYEEFSEELCFLNGAKIVVKSR